MAAISSVEALISCVDAEISVAMAAASSEAARIAPTSRRNATTIECTEDISSPTSAASARWVKTVTERSPLATRLAIAPAARTGSVTRRPSRRDSQNSAPTAIAATSSAPSQTARCVLRAVANAVASGSRYNTHHVPPPPWLAGTLTTNSSSPRTVGPATNEMPSNGIWSSKRESFTTVSGGL